MNQLENCQARYRSNTWIGRTRTDGIYEFEPSKFDFMYMAYFPIPGPEFCVTTPFSGSVNIGQTKIKHAEDLTGVIMFY